MIDTIVSVKSRDGRKPGFIKFSSAGEISTFKDSALETAVSLIGQRVEFELEERESGGKTYRNVASVKLAGGSAQPGVPVLVSNERVSIDPAVVQFKRIADAFESLVTLLASGPGPASSLALDDTEVKTRRLGDRVGQDAARAMVNALREKHKDDVEAFVAALAALLAAHKVS